MLTPIGTRQLMPRTSAERGGVCGAWLRQKYKPTLKRESSALLNFVAFCAELRFLARVDARWCRREKYKQIRRKTLLYASEKRMKACQSAWRRRKYKPTFTGVTNWVCSGSIWQLRQRTRTWQSARGVGVVKRTWLRSKCSRDPAGQTEVFVPVSRLRTFNWIYSYRQLAVRIVVSAIAVFWLVDDVIGAYL